MNKEKEGIQFVIFYLKNTQRKGGNNKWDRESKRYRYLQHQNLECQYIKSAWEKVSNI